MNTTNSERASAATVQFAWVMRIFSAIYLIGGLLFLFMSEELFYLINIGPRVLKIFEEVPIPFDRFWSVLSTSMMAMLSLCSFYSSLHPRNRSYLSIHMLSKVVSVFGFTWMFFRHRPFFAYALGSLTDAGVILVVMVFFLRSEYASRRS